MSEFPYRSALIVGTVSIKGFAESAGFAMGKFAFCQHSRQASFWRNLVTYCSVRRAGNC